MKQLEQKRLWDGMKTGIHLYKHLLCCIKRPTENVLQLVKVKFKAWSVRTELKTYRRQQNIDKWIQPYLKIVRQNLNLSKSVLSLAKSFKCGLPSCSTTILSHSSFKHRDIIDQFFQLPWFFRFKPTSQPVKYSLNVDQLTRKPWMRKNWMMKF